MPRNAQPQPNAKRRRRPTARSVTMQASVDQWNRWREHYNPSRGLTVARAVGLVESYTRGEFADLMWTFGAPFMGIECADPDLLAIIDRRCSALQEMDWNAQEETGDKVDDKLAEDQAAMIEEMANGIDNLYEAIDHLAIAFNRGFSHCEKVDDYAGDLIELRCIDQWNVVRDGMRGAWKYNPDALQTTFRSLPAENILDPAWTVVREVKRPVGRIALLKYIRANLTDRNWDAFMEIFGIQAGVVIGPPDMNPDDEADFEEAAAAIAKGGSGSLPSGSEWVPNPATQKEIGPYKTYLEYLTEKLILVGTGGKLTMLAESGSGTLAGNAHADVFEQLARAEARRISELIQDQVFKPRLEAAFPGKDICAYWELAFREEVDASQVIDDAVKLTQAGYLIDPEELSEKTGYKLTLKSGLAVSGGSEDQKGGLQGVAKAPDAPEEASGSVTTAENGSGASESISDGNLKNRDSATSDDLEGLLRGALSGGVDRWQITLASALAEGAQTAPPDLDPQSSIPTPPQS